MIGADLGSITLREIVSQFFILKYKKVLSVFVDESGDTGFIGEASKFYIIVFVFHDQKDDITPHLSKIADRPPFHIAPIIRKENEYKDIDVPTRVKMIRELFA